MKNNDSPQTGACRDSPCHGAGHYTDDHSNGVRGIGLHVYADTAIAPTTLIIELDKGVLVV